MHVVISCTPRQWQPSRTPDHCMQLLIVALVRIALGLFCSVGYSSQLPASANLTILPRPRVIDSSSAVAHSQAIYTMQSKRSRQYQQSRSVGRTLV
ncbi:hypothetical protein F5Y12DRAFT_733445 [Xylaria sp. FL1777]|nr:hypothetical protein F5Y12DRAFT_733445 [Xylaria sp. FL1777]